MEHAAFAGSVGLAVILPARVGAIELGLPVVVTALALARCARRRESPWRTLAPLAWCWLGTFAVCCVAPRFAVSLLVATFAFLVLGALVAALHLPMQGAAPTTGPKSF